MFDTLSEKQREIVFNKQGKFVVRACPGSGKTYSVSARLAKEISDWDKRSQGVATLSFTNIAWKEIENQVHKHFSIRKPVPYPHFLGTIDSFINQFIFLPFGHLVMECGVRPTLVGEPHGTWISGRYERDYDQYFNHVSYGVNDELIYPEIPGVFHFSFNKIYGKDGSKSGHAKNLQQTKKRFWKLGYATQQDANYFAMKLLENYSSIPKAIVHRFPVFIVDEAQDTSDIQMKMIDILIEHGLEDIILIGDPDQAIFEWNDAKPNLFTEKFEAWQDNSVVLNENRRSSQSICNCTYPLSSLETISSAVTEEVKEFDYIPEIFTYNEDDLTSTIDYFLERCKTENIDISPDNVAVLYRSKALFNSITGAPRNESRAMPWVQGDTFTRDFAKGKFLYEQVDFKQGFKLIESAIYKGINKRNYCSKENIDTMIAKTGFAKHRKRVLAFINMLPSAEGTIGDWIDQTNAIIQDKNVNIQLQYKEEGRNLTFDEIYNQAKEESVERDYRLGTIHSAKGETFEAVLVILKKKGIGKHYKTMLRNGETVSDNEELRIVYVGITRPRRILMIAVPDIENINAWEERLLKN